MGPIKKHSFCDQRTCRPLFLGADKVEHNRDADEIPSGDRESFFGARNAKPQVWKRTDGTSAGPGVGGDSV